MGLVRALRDGLASIPGRALLPGRSHQPHAVLAFNVEAWMLQTSARCSTSTTTSPAYRAPLRRVVHEQLGTVKIRGLSPVRIGPFNTQEHVEKASTQARNRLNAEAPRKQLN